MQNIFQIKEMHTKEFYLEIGKSMTHSLLGAEEFAKWMSIAHSLELFRGGPVYPKQDLVMEH